MGERNLYICNLFKYILSDFYVLKTAVVSENRPQWQAHSFK